MQIPLDGTDSRDLESRATNSEENNVPITYAPLIYSHQKIVLFFVTIPDGNYRRGYYFFVFLKFSVVISVENPPIFLGESIKFVGKFF